MSLQQQLFHELHFVVDRTSQTYSIKKKHEQGYIQLMLTHLKVLDSTKRFCAQACNLISYITVSPHIWLLHEVLDFPQDKSSINIGA